MLFEIAHHGTRYEHPFDERPTAFFSSAIVEAEDAEALVEWVTKVHYPIHDRVGFDPSCQAVSISAFKPVRIVKNTSTLEGSSKWMAAASAHSSVLWSTDCTHEENEMGIREMNRRIHQNDNIKVTVRS